MIIEISVWVVAGGTRGIGLALARELLAAGARVALSDKDAAAPTAAVTQLSTPSAIAIPADVSSAAAISALAQQAGEHLGPIEVWGNNAGRARHRRIVVYTEAEIDLMLTVNLKDTILGSQAALRAMAPRRCGHIINIVSTETVYCAAKRGARDFSKIMRKEAAPHNVRMTAVLPGGFDTAFWAETAQGHQMPVEIFLTATQAATAVLAHTELGLGQIALDCGFGDQSYINRVFRRRTKQTSGDYRHAHQPAAPKS
jgi:NAD(P)-dependent dehydrogenase (short-subunit alcohol dehydrogenase family)